VDVRRTADGKLIIYHDPTLERTTKRVGRVNKKTYPEIIKLDAGKGEKVPSLYDVLILVKNKVGLVIEIKEPGTELDVLDMVEDQGMEKDVIFASFYHKVLLNLKYFKSDIRTGIIFAGSPVHPARIAIDARADIIFIRKDFIDMEMVKECHDNLLKIYSWVIDDLEDYKAMKNLMIDGLVSNTLITLV
jgi:glycerophosphoryl diester phosphodiesterase